MPSHDPGSPPASGAVAGRVDDAQLVARERRHLEELIAQVPGVVWEAQPRGSDGALVAHLVSRQAETLLGHPLSRWRETPEFWLEITHPEDRERVRQAAREVMRGGGIATLGFRWLHREGRVLWMEAHCAVLDNGDGTPVGMRVVAVDISRWQHVEEDARRQREKFEHAARVTTLNQLAASLAYELNQPLNAILNNAEAARLKLERRRPPLTEIAEILDDIVADDQRAGDIIRCVRDQVRLAAAEMTALDLNSVLDDIASLMHSEALLRGVTLEFVRSPTRIVVNGDRVQLQQVLLNLVANAFDAVRPNARVHRRVVVRALCSGASFAAVAVEDSGPGVDPGILDRGRNSPVPGGSGGRSVGHGLAIASGIVDAHAGRLWAANHRGRGALFVVGFPVVDQPLPH